uniref:Glycosyltransferase family 92 protein n=1 Tax=Panagrellus redivivus TaxID=6233 RepID=A0A7E4W4V6_PANRE
MMQTSRKPAVLVLLCLAVIFITIHREPSRLLLLNDQDDSILVAPPENGVSSKFPALSKPIIKNFTVADTVIGTAFSKNHFAEALRSCISMKKHPSMTNLINNGTIKVIAYNMGGLGETELSLYKKHCPFVEVRALDFSTYPPFVSDLMQYRWKPLIIAKLMEVRPVVFYLDTSVVFMNSSNDSFEKVVTSMNQKYSKCGIRTLGVTYHSIVAATHPGIYQYFKNDTMNHVKSTRMVAATTYLAVRNPAGIKTMKKIVDCALTKECMAPTGSSVLCNYARLNVAKYADCHRYDQSALALALLDCSHSQNDYAGNTDLIDMQRRSAVVKFWKNYKGNDKGGEYKFYLGEIKEFYLDKHQDE